MGMRQSPHEKAATVNLFLEFIGEAEAKVFPYGFWLKRVGKCSYGDAIEICKGLENLPIKYNKAGVIINKLKKFNAPSTTSN
jgi:hypothetical protein